MKISISTLLFVLFLFGFSGCIAEDLVETFDQSTDGVTIWVYAQFNVPNKDGIEDYYYYGRVSEKVYNSFVDHKVKEGVVVLRDVRYWSNDDGYQEYADDLDSGTLIFRLEDIAFMRLQKGDPLLLREKEDDPEVVDS